jgi:hypothetical protein
MREVAPMLTAAAIAARRLPSAPVTRGARGHISSQFIRPDTVPGSSYHRAKYGDSQADRFLDSDPGGFSCGIGLNQKRSGARGRLGSTIAHSIHIEVIMTTRRSRVRSHSCD